MLKRCVDAAEQTASPNGHRQAAMQSPVLARLASLVAGPAALREDPMRDLLGAVMLGDQEAE